jgi:CRISP-associated protein Cas1
MKADRPRNLHILPRFGEGLTYVYLEHVRVDRHNQAVAAWDEHGMVPIPCASLAALLLGPGSTITHLAVRTLADHGCSIVWVGESGVRFYAAGTGETHHTHLLERQAVLWADPRSRLRTARQMYAMRFPGEEVGELSMAQLRGREGARVKRAYRLASDESGVPWTGRSYRQDDWGATDPVNRALSSANACLYGVCHAGIVSLGCAPGLGFIHTGKQLSFVYDLADLYKPVTSIPAAFAAATHGPFDIDRRARLACRKIFQDTKLLVRIVADLHHLFGPEGDEGPLDELSVSPVYLWDPYSDDAPGGKNYAEDE